MKGFAVKYVSIVGVMMFMFTQFVACGAEMYKVSLEDDSEQKYATEGTTDPSSPNYGLHAANGWAKLPVHFKVGQKLDALQQAGLTRAMQTWQGAVGKQLFVFEGVHVGVNGDSFEDLYSSLDDDTNGHYLDGIWSKNGKKDYVLATTIWDYNTSDYQSIDTADIRFNGQHYLIGNSLESISEDGKRPVVDMETLALHELGHLLGLAHVDGQFDPESIMNPELYIGEGMYNRSLSRGDIERVQKIYGCEGASCDIDGIYKRLQKIDRSSEQVAH